MVPLTLSLFCALVAGLSLLGLLLLKHSAENICDPVWIMENKEQIKHWASVFANTAVIFTLGAIFL